MDDSLAQWVPSGWAVPAAARLEYATQQALAALAMTGDRPVQDRLRRFYNVESDYAGATFTTLPGTDPDRIEPVDLLAAHLLSVPIPAGAVRRLTEPGPTRDLVTQTLAQLPDESLARAGAETLLAMEGAHTAVKAALSGPHVKSANAWVTASKICARKRPRLFPVRDNDVCRVLGLLPKNDYTTDWQVYRALMRDEAVSRAITDAAQAADDDGAAGDGRRVVLEREPLRLLDAALWTFANRHF